MKPNNLTRMLDAKNVKYSLYEMPTEKLGAVETARILGVPLELVYKTIVISREGKGKNILAVVPGQGDVDLKLLAKALGEKRVHLPTEREAEKITGMLAGGISPLALINRGFQVVLDRSAQAHREIYISGGRRGLNIRLSPQDLMALTNATLADISRVDQSLIEG